MEDWYLIRNTNGVLSYELKSGKRTIWDINDFSSATSYLIYPGLKEKMKVTPTAPIKPSEKTNAGANNNAGTEVKPNNDGNANAGTNNNAGTNSSSAVAPAPGAAGPDFGQNPQGDGNNFGPKTEAKEEAKAETKEGTLPNTGMTTSSTVALGLSLIVLVGFAVRRKLNN